MSTSYFTIGSVSDWYAAINDSQLINPTANTYFLTADLTFDPLNKPYINNGNNDTDYLLIHWLPSCTPSCRRREGR